MEILNTISENLYDAKLYTLISLYLLVNSLLIKDHERIVRFFHIFKNALLFAMWAILMLMGLDKLGVYQLRLHTIHFIFLLSVLLSLPFLYMKMSEKLSEFFKKLITNAFVHTLFWLTFIFLLFSNFFFKIDFIEKYYFFIFYTLVPLTFLSDVFSPPVDDEDEDEEDDDKPLSELLFPWIKKRSNGKA